MKITKLTQFPYRGPDGKMVYPMGRAGVIRDQAEIAIAMMRARLTPDQAIALTYGAEIADVIRDDIRVMSRRRTVTTARRLARRSGTVLA